MNKSNIIDVISCLFILLFLYTGITKLLDQEFFVITLRKTPIRAFGVFLSWAVPIVELIVVALLIIPIFRYRPQLRKWGLYSSAFLMAVFTLYVGYMLKFWPSLPCTCGGVVRLMNWHQHFYFNVTFTTIALAAIWLDKQVFHPNQPLAVNR